MEVEDEALAEFSACKASLTWFEGKDMVRGEGINSREGVPTT